MIVRACATPEKKAFRKKILKTRRAELGTVGETLKKIATDEVVRCKTLFKEHVAFFNDDEPEVVPVRVESFIEK